MPPAGKNQWVPTITFQERREICFGQSFYLSQVKGQGQGHRDPKIVCDTPKSQDVLTQQIWYS